MELATGAAAARGLSFRPMTDDDLPFAASLYASTRADEFAATGWPPEVQRQFLLDQFRLQHSHYRQHYPGADWLIVELAGAAIGRLSIDETPHQMHLIDIALLPDQRCAGFGTFILSGLLADAGPKSKKVSLHVERTNRALSLYRRLGFVETEDRGLHLLMEWPIS